MRLIVFILFMLLNANCFAAIYHIDPTVADGGTGTASDPYNEWGDLPSMNTGDDVFFKCATTYSPSGSLVVTWQGTSGDPATIGAYYMDGGSPVYGVSGTRPIISGSSYTVPSSIYAGLFEVSSKNYVHFYNIILFESYGYGFNVYGNLSTPSNSANFLISNCKVDGAGLSGIMINRNRENYGQVLNCEVTKTGYAWKYLGNPFWGIGITVPNSPYSYTRIAGNYVHHNWGEGIGGFCDKISGSDNSGYYTIEDNVVFENRRVDVYLDGVEGCTVRRNVLAGANTTTTYMSGGLIEGRYWNQYGVWMNSEDYNGNSADNKNNLVYNNVIVGHYVGIGIAAETSATEFSGNKIFSNTIIGNRYNWSIGSQLQNATTSNNELKNNSFFCPAAANCTNIGSDVSWADTVITAAYNAWESPIPAYAGDATYDQTVADADFPTGIDWQDIEESDLATLASFAKFVSGSDLQNNGVALGSPYDVDAFGTDRPKGSAWDIGFYELDEDPPPDPSPGSVVINPAGSGSVTIDPGGSGSVQIVTQ